MTESNGGHSLNATNLLIDSSTVLVCGLALLNLIYKRSTWAYLFAKDKPERFDRSRLPKYFATVGISAATLALYSVIATRNGLLIAQFTLGNLFFVAAGCINPILYRPKKQR